jgi:hypothetical protein
MAHIMDTAQEVLTQWSLLSTEWRKPPAFSYAGPCLTAEMLTEIVPTLFSLLSAVYEQRGAD